MPDIVPEGGALKRTKTPWTQSANLEIHGRLPARDRNTKPIIHINVVINTRNALIFKISGLFSRSIFEIEGVGSREWPERDPSKCQICLEARGALNQAD